ncbi:MAG: transglutaminase domain-containing protein [Oscillospiraceae bacterium]|nr:transglutaminase domain-containing protein [Oscillospiraceae bacterium]
MRKIMIWIVVAVVLAASSLVTCAVVFEPSPVVEAVAVELGSKEIPLEQFVKEEKKVTLLTDISGISLEQLGEHKLEFSYKKKNYVSTLKVVDTTKPTGTPVEHTIYNDETLTPDAFVKDIADATEVTVAFEKTPDFTKLGEQTVTIRLTDTSGNIGLVSAKVTVIADTTAPVFSEMEKLTVNIGQAVSYREGVTATDDRDGEISFTIDASAVNLEQEGTYTIVYEAADKSGNVTKVERELFVSDKLVVNAELIDEMAQEILDKIIEDGMSDHDKIYAVFMYIRKNVSYSSSKETELLAAAYKAMKYKKGDCYNYFAIAKVLLDKLGIQNLPVERYKGKSSHFWLLVNIGTGWYHYDASPQSAEDPFRCFMKTDKQVNAYARSRQDGRKDYYQIDYSKYPELATEKYKEP